MEDKSKDMMISVKSLVTSFLVAAIFFGLGFVFGIYGPVGDEGVSDRTISVDGAAEVSASPDENVFYVNFEEEDQDQASARAKVVAKSDAVIAALTELGVKKTDITSDISTYDDYDCFDDCTEPTGVNAYSNLQIRVNDTDLAEKVYNYLLTSEASGQVSPSSTFSAEKEKELKREARALAVADAKEQAQQLANELDAEVDLIQ